MNVALLNQGRETGRRKVAVVGSGISGAAAAWALNRTADVTLFEAAARPGGHTATVDVDYDGTHIAVDTGFIVYNELNYPDLTALFSHLGVATHASDMGFSLSLDGGRLEWSGASCRAIFAQKRNFFSPSFLWMLREILRFNRQCVEDRDAGHLAHRSIGDYLEHRRILGQLPRQLPDPDGRCDLVDTAHQDARLSCRGLRLVLREPPPHPQAAAGLAHRHRRLTKLSRKIARAARPGASGYRRR